jgi:hypothetical protein
VVIAVSDISSDEGGEIRVAAKKKAGKKKATKKGGKK